jgi:hypothetical protein
MLLCGGETFGGLPYCVATFFSFFSCFFEVKASMTSYNCQHREFYLTFAVMFFYIFKKINDFNIMSHMIKIYIYISM